MIGKNKKLIVVVTDDGEFRSYYLKEEVLPKYEIVKFDGMDSKNLTDEQDVGEYVDNIVKKLGYLSSTQVQVLFVFEKENEHFVEWFCSNMKDKFQVVLENFIITQGKLANVLKGYGVQIKDDYIVCDGKQYYYRVIGGKELILEKRKEERKSVAESVQKHKVGQDSEEKIRKIVKPPILKKIKVEKKIDLPKLPPVPVEESKGDESKCMTHEEAQDLWDKIMADDSDE